MARDRTGSAPTMAGRQAHRRGQHALRSLVLVTTGALAVTTAGLVLVEPAAQAATTTVLSDTFTRSLTSGWGTADTGGAWTPRGGSSSQYGVNGSAGTLTLSPGNGLNVDANAVSALNQDITVSLTANKVATGGGNYFTVVARRQPTFEQYAVQISLGSSTPSLTVFRRDATQKQFNIGTTATLTGTTFTASSWWKLRFAVTGTNPTTLTAKAWPATAAEPAAWNITATDSTAALQVAGSPGYSAYLSSGATNAPVTQLVDDLVVTSTTAGTPAPTGLTATAGDKQVALAWNAVAGATSYSVYRGGTLLTTTSATTLTDSGLTNGTTYSYTVTATGPAGTSTSSTSVSATPLAVPATPSGLTATAGDTVVALAWSSTAGATGYTVFRGGTPIASVSSASYADTGLVNSTTYSYSVAAKNASGTSAPSSAVTATPLASGPPSGRPSADAGALAIGTASYPVPADAIYVATSGSDSTGSGSAGAPFATVARALTAVSAGGTIVVRGGTYHQDVTTIATPVTIENYPGEAVWFDGAAAATGWTARGTAWTTPYPYAFDDSPTYTVGAPDNTAYGWNFINPAYPMASYPDQVWIAGVEQTQVASISAVVAGTFYVDRANKLLYVGTDPAAGAEYSTYTQAFSITANNVTLRGFGVERYADSVPMAGVVVDTASGLTMENTSVIDSATEGIGVEGPNGILRHVTVTGSGLTGVHAYHADGLVVDGLNAQFNTDQHFNYIPVSGGIKFTKSRNVTLKNSILANNLGQGAWFDEACYNLTIVGNEFYQNASLGLYTEISTLGLVANNVFTRNGADGYKIDSTSAMTVWNNTFVDNAISDYRARDLNMVQSPRVYSCSAVGADSRFCPGGDPTMSWQTHNIDIRNNIFKQSAGQAMLAFEDYTFTNTALQMNITPNNNEYVRTATGTGTRWLFIWSAGAANNKNPYVFTTLPAFQTAQHVDLDSVYADVGAAVPTPKPVGLSAAVAAAISRPTGELHMGAY